jgi:hypothetical protein
MGEIIGWSFVAILIFGAFAANWSARQAASWIPRNAKVEEIEYISSWSRRGRMAYYSKALKATLTRRDGTVAEETFKYDQAAGGAREEAYRLASAWVSRTSRADSEGENKPSGG